MHTLFRVFAAGASEKTLKRLCIPYRKVYIHVGHHAGYYPGAKTIDLKLLFSPEVSPKQHFLVPYAHSS
jgi:hypothetical protein